MMAKQLLPADGAGAGCGKGGKEQAFPTVAGKGPDAGRQAGWLAGWLAAGCQAEDDVCTMGAGYYLKNHSKSYH